jgi:CheY-like chemotaxis protein
VALTDVEAFDLVLMDLHMPKMDGATAAREITARTGGHPPVVAMTAAVLSEDRAHCAEAGMVDFVAKPVDPDDLVRVLRRWLPEALVAANAARAAGVKAVPPSPSKSPEPLLPMLCGFDAAAALRRLHGNRDRFTCLLRSFAAQHGECGRQIKQLLADGALAQAHHALHALKGISATLGLVGVSAASRAVELALEVASDASASAATQAALQRRLAALCACLADAVVGIASLDETPPASGQSLLTFDPFAMAHLLQELRRYVNEQELIPDTLLDELKRMAADEPPAGRAATLLQHIFDFDHAAALLDIDRIEGELHTES